MIIASIANTATTTALSYCISIPTIHISISIGSCSCFSEERSLSSSRSSFQRSGGRSRRLSLQFFSVAMTLR